jgi:uncharacterized delta-60 repeat protein
MGKYQNKFFIMYILILFLVEFGFAQTERWVYRYDGPANNADVAYALVYGQDHNIYAAGKIYGSTTSDDFAVISVDTAGNENWVYTYWAPSGDIARAITYGLDGNIYAAGKIYQSGENNNFIVVSLNPSGDTNWVYLYDGADHGNDEANSIVYGLDNNIYATGFSIASADADLIVISLSSAGDTNWVFRYPGPGGGAENGNSIVFGADSNLYVAGYSTSASYFDFIIMSLSTDGDTNWVYRYDGPLSGYDRGYAITYGTDDNIYASGYAAGIGTSYDFTVISLTHTATERWVYDYDGPGSSDDESYALVYGSDGNIYAAGYSEGSASSADFTVISIAGGGAERWIYRYNGPGDDWEEAYSIAYGADGNVYAAGYNALIDGSYNFIVTNLDKDTGDENWVYEYDGPGNDDDLANAIVCGDDGNLYAAGHSTGSGTASDFTIISLAGESGIEEDQTKPSLQPLFSVASFFRENILLQFSEPSQKPLEINLYDVCGRCVYEKTLNSTLNRIEIKDNNIRALCSGVYFLSVFSGNSELGRVKLVKL